MQGRLGWCLPSRAVNRLLALVTCTYAQAEQMEGDERTWMSSWSDRQSSIETTSGWFGMRTVERNFPLNICVMGDPSKLVYFRRCIRQQCQAQCRYSCHTVKFGLLPSVWSN